MVRVRESKKNQIEQATKRKSKQATPRSDATISRPLKRPKKGDTAEYKGGPKIEIGQFEECGTTHTKQKRSRRSRKLLADIKKSSRTDAVGKDCSSDEVELSKTTNVNPTGSQDASIGKLAEISQTDCKRKNAKMAITEISIDKTQPLRMCSEGISSSTKFDDSSSQDASIGKVAEISQEKAKIPITEISFDATLPLHMCSEGMSSSTKLDDSIKNAVDKDCSSVEVALPTTTNVNPTGGTVNQLNEANESIVELPVIDCMNNNVLGSNQKLPFVKSSTVWEMIDSMEIFQKMEQYPHFHPLYKFDEEYREGLAIGAMVTFANLVEKTCKLQLDDPRSIWARHLEILFDLEKHGLDVQVLRDRLNKLLVIKDRQEQKLEELKKLEILLSENVKENTKTDEEIDKLKEKVREFKEKRASVMSIKKIQDSETAALQLRADDKREGIRSNQLDFERLTAAPC